MPAPSERPLSHSSSPMGDRRAGSRRVTRIALVILGAFFILEAVAGVLTNSLALLADAGHLLTDVGALLMALGAFWLAARPATATRTYGFHRMEILAALVNGLTLWAVAAYIGFEAYRRISEPPEVSSLPMLLVAVVGFTGQFLVTIILRRSARESLNVRAAYLHVATDVVQSVGVIGAGALMLLFGWFLADPIISLLIAALITVSGGRIVLAAVHILLEAAPSHVDVDALQRTLEAVPEVQEVHDLHTWTITSGYDAMSAHVVMRRGVDARESQALLAHLRRLASRLFGIDHVTIQLESAPLACPEDHTPPQEKVGGAAP